MGKGRPREARVKAVRGGLGTAKVARTERQKGKPAGAESDLAGGGLRQAGAEPRSAVVLPVGRQNRLQLADQAYDRAARILASITPDLIARATLYQRAIAAAVLVDKVAMLHRLERESGPLADVVSVRIQRSPIGSAEVAIRLGPGRAPVAEGTMRHSLPVIQSVGSVPEPSCSDEYDAASAVRSECAAGGGSPGLAAPPSEEMGPPPAFSPPKAESQDVQAGSNGTLEPAVEILHAETVYTSPFSPEDDSPPTPPSMVLDLTPPPVPRGTPILRPRNSLANKILGKVPHAKLVP